MSSRNLLLGIIGVLCGVWIGFGRHFFGIGGGLTLWYVPLIALPYVLLQFAVIRRMSVANERGYSEGRAVYVSLILSWLCALGFGLTVPDTANDRLMSVLTLFAGEAWDGMSFALCNPLGIIMFATSVAALAFAIAAGRDPRLSEDELLDSGELEPKMVPHPLHRDS